MSKNFWKKLPKPFFVLAPMEDVTDVIFRHVIAHAAAPDVYFTEFTNSASYAHQNAKESLRGRLYFTEDEQPMVAHIWGDDVEDFKVMSIGLKEMGFKGIDINMGCPAPNVFKHGRGSGLILRPEKAAALIAAAKTGGLPVSVKTRLAHADLKEWKTWITHLLKQDIANLSVHLRTKVEMSKADAHYELIDELVALRDEIAPQTLITINGDIMNYDEGMTLYEHYGVDGIMIGRGIFANPYAFEKEVKNHSPKQLLDLLKYHLDLYIHYTELEEKLSKPLHRFFKIYIKEFKGAAQLRNDLMGTKTAAQAKNVLQAFDQTEAYQQLR